MRNLIRVIVIVFFLSMQQLYSQSLTSARYDADPVNMNPSQTGDFNGSWRVTVNYNELKTLSVPFRNYMITYDQPVFIKGRKIGLGVSVLHDEMGNNIFNKEKVCLSGSYFYTLHGNSIKIGMQAGYVSSAVKLENEIWPDQYNRLAGNFDPVIESGENIHNNIGYFDLNIGVSWKKIFRRHTPELGLSVQHINSPDVSYLSDNIRLKPVFVFHGTNNLLLNQKVYITPVCIYKTDFSEKYLSYGLSGSYKFAGSFLEKSVFIGLDLKNSFHQLNAYSFYGGLKYNQWQFGVSYDYNILSAKNNLSVHGPMEIYIRYTALSSRLQNFSVPCSRF